MTPAETLAGEWLELFQSRTSKPLNNKGFQAKYNTIDSKYRKLPVEMQGEFTGIIRKKTKQLLRPKEKHDESQENG